VRRLFAVLAFCAVVACASAPEDLPVSPDFVVENAGERTLEALPEGALYWRIETFPSLDAAQAAAGPTSLAATISGRHWLVTLGARGATTPGATHVAELGPLPRIAAQHYRLRLNHAHAPPGAATSVHNHPGSEAFYVLSGQLSQRTTHGISVVDAGETQNGHAPGMTMQLQSTGAEALDQLVLFVVDADQPFSSPASFSH
jgi:mannose-6-phosphate isomerase-like protein (cupin superfamily)